MMHKLGLADELAETRAEITRLKEREAALQSAVLAFEGNVPEGRWSRIEVVTRRQRVFDQARLPSEVLADPRFWREKLSTLVHCLPLEAQRHRPGWPIQRMGQAKMAHH